MLNKILLIIGIILIIYGYLNIIITSFKSKKSNTTSSETSLKILDDEYSINLIKSKESIFSKYNISRKMVKLSSNTYDSSTYFYNAIAALLSGYAKTNNKYLEIISKIFKELKFISFSPIVMIIISSIITNITDAKIGIIFIIIIAIYQYLLNTINTEIIEELKIEEEIQKVLNIFTNTNKIFFIATLTQIIRIVSIMLNINI